MPATDPAATVDATAQATTDAAATTATTTTATTDTTASAASTGAAATDTTATTTTTDAAAVAATTTTTPAVPEKYDLKLPDGSTADATLVERTAAIARALGLSNDGAQTLLDQTVQDETARATALVAAQQAAADSWKNGGTEFVKRDTQWRADALADPDIGAGDPAKFAQSIEKAQQALEKYGPGLKTYLNETGLGSHPEAIKFLANIGRAMSESALVVGASGTTGKPKTTAQLMYPEHYNDDGTPKT